MNTGNQTENKIGKQPRLQSMTDEYAKNSGLSTLIEDISLENGLLDFDSRAGIPIPLHLLDLDEVEISVSELASDSIEILHEFINTPETALEYPFLLTGNFEEDGGINIEELNILYTEGEKLSGTSVEINSGVLGAKVNTSLKNGRSVYILGHTHPRLSNKTQKGILQVSQKLKDKHGIKPLGLNLSLQDLYQLVSFHNVLAEMLPGEGKVFIAVLMYDGTMEAVYAENGKFRRRKIKYN